MAGESHSPEQAAPQTQKPTGMEALRDRAQRNNWMDKQVTRRGLFTTAGSIGLGATIGVSAIDATKRIGFLQKLFGRKMKEVSPVLPSSEKFQPLSPNELVQKQGQSDLSEIEKYEYQWVTVDENGKDIDSEKPVLVEGVLNTVQLSGGFEGPALKLRKGIEKDAEAITILKDDAEKQIPDMKGTFTRVRGKDSYIHDSSGESTNVYWAFATGQHTPGGIKDFFGTPSRMPIEKGEAPFLLSKNFVSAIKPRT